MLIGYTRTAAAQKSMSTKKPQNQPRVVKAIGNPGPGENWKDSNKSEAGKGEEEEGEEMGGEGGGGVVWL